MLDELSGLLDIKLYKWPICPRAVPGAGEIAPKCVDVINGLIPPSTHLGIGSGYSPTDLKSMELYKAADCCLAGDTQIPR
jgi:hypothetical protein